MTEELHAAPMERAKMARIFLRPKRAHSRTVFTGPAQISPFYDSKPTGQNRMVSSPDPPDTPRTSLFRKSKTLVFDPPRFHADVLHPARTNSPGCQNLSEPVPSPDSPEPPENPAGQKTPTAKG